MATLSLYQAVNLFQPEDWGNRYEVGYSSTSAAYRYVKYEYDSNTGLFNDVTRYETFYGTFSFPSSGGVSGRLTGYELRNSAGPIALATVNVDAALAYSYVKTNSRTGLLNYFFPGNDTINGSSSQDYITGFGGNDVIDLKGGEDYVFLYGPGSNYTLNFPTQFNVTVTDNTGDEGTDQIFNAEYLKYSDSDWFLLPVYLDLDKSLFFNGSKNDTVRGITKLDMFGYSFSSNVADISISSGALIVTTSATGESDTLYNFERILFQDKAIAFDTTSVAGQAYRIYKAAFDRDPMINDAAGLGYWIAQMDNGMDLIEVAARFIDSIEFRSLYGANPTNSEFLIKVYNNVLDRNPDGTGYAWWVDQLENNPEKTWQKVLSDFSESTENQANVASLITGGIGYELFVV